MKIFSDISQWQQFRKQLKDESLGFVPTMGNLHQGHLSLIERSQRENKLSIVSIFINPTQFNLSEDYDNYPRTLAEDLSLLQENGVDYCFLPEKEQIYPDGYCYQIHENKLSRIMEGESRPGHFNGVLTIVLKLLQLIKPAKAYFGEKDYQQYLLIKDMVTAFFLDTDIVLCPTVREDSGLAYSSRNRRLNAAAKSKAIQFAQIFRSYSEVEDIIQRLTQEEITIDYIKRHNNRLFAAVKIDGIRLIDNYALEL